MAAIGCAGSLQQTQGEWPRRSGLPQYTHRYTPRQWCQRSSADMTAAAAAPPPKNGNNRVYRTPWTIAVQWPCGMAYRTRQNTDSAATSMNPPTNAAAPATSVRRYATESGGN